MIEQQNTTTTTTTQTFQHKPDLIQGIRRIGDQLPEEDLLVAVEGVDDQGHQLGNLGLEGEGLGFLGHLDLIKFVGISKIKSTKDALRG